MVYSKREHCMSVMFGASILAVFFGFVSAIYLTSGVLSTYVKTYAYVSTTCTYADVRSVGRLLCPCDSHRTRQNTCMNQTFECVNVLVEYPLTEGGSMEAYMMQSYKTVHWMMMDRKLIRRHHCYFAECEGTQEETDAAVAGAIAGVSELSLAPFPCSYSTRKPEEVIQFERFSDEVISASTVCGALFVGGGLAALLIYNFGFKTSAAKLNMYS